MTPRRLAQLRDYAEGLALRGIGCQRDLDDIVKALDELKDLQQWADAITSMPTRPQPKHSASPVPKPKRAA